MGIEIRRFSASVPPRTSLRQNIILAFTYPPPANSFLPHTMLRSAPRVSAHTTHRRMAQAPGNGADAKNGARHPPLAPSPSAEKRTHQPPVFLGGVSGEYDFPGASAGALYDGFHPGGTPIPVTAASAYRSPTTTGDARTAEDATSRRAAQLKRCRGAGFIAALDQSGGSTPRALSLYGINDIRADDKDAMFDAVHAMRTRIVTADAFDGDKIFGAILFQDTVFHRLVQGKKPTATYLWEDKGIVPFLKIDKGLQPEADGVQLMKPIPELDRTLSWCGGGGSGGGTKDPGSLKKVLDIADELGIPGADVSAGDCVFGTKARSVIRRNAPVGIEAVVTQQFELAARVIRRGLVPIIEPEVDIDCADKAAAEVTLKDSLSRALDVMETLHDADLYPLVIFKLTLPEDPTLYDSFVRDPRVLRVVALSGGYDRATSTTRLQRCAGMSASFSRALTEGLSVQMSDAEFESALGASVKAIFKAAAA